MPFHAATNLLQQTFAVCVWGAHKAKPPIHSKTPNNRNQEFEHHVAFEISTFHHCAANMLSQSRTHPHCKVFRRTTFEGMRHISFEKLYGRIRHLVILKRILINDNIVLIQRKSQLEDIDICNKLAHQGFERWFQLPSASDS